MKGIWKDDEVKDLFEQVEKIKSQGKSIKEAFAFHAKKYFRKADSVRNYYYHEIDRLREDKERCSRIGINLLGHQKNQFCFFSEEEKNSIIEKIQQKLKEGYSVRKACLLLSGGDVKEMVRLQNKYRSSVQGKDNVLKFKPAQTSKISDHDINSLFLGLVKLIKHNVEEEAKNQIASERMALKAEVRNLMVQIGERERSEKSLQEKINEIKRENVLLKKKLLFATCDKARSMTKSHNQV